MLTLLNVLVTDIEPAKALGKAYKCGSAALFKRATIRMLHVACFLL